ncbi:achaete-scute complex 3 [Cichlidogyrus casuarinus]|uniref:Achaete-scute complex 3 n=1 Tax=Cichlidogyrus casuarinus TaxID=1844966 RepID=A0ABD2PJQ5_9PLAT
MSIFLRQEGDNSQEQRFHCPDDWLFSYQHEQQQQEQQDQGWSSENDTYAKVQKCSSGETAQLCSHSDQETVQSTIQYECAKHFIRKRNARERERVRCVNAGYEKLRRQIPNVPGPENRRMAKVDILRAAIRYIRSLEEALADNSSLSQRYFSQLPYNNAKMHYFHNSM